MTLLVNIYNCLKTDQNWPKIVSVDFNNHVLSF